MTALLRVFAVVMAVLVAACGGDAGDGGTPSSAPRSFTGQAQKGPLAIGSQVSASELDATLNPTGKVYNVLTRDNFGTFAVANVGTDLVEISASGYYVDDLSGALAAAPIQLHAYVDLRQAATPTVNLLTTMQQPRINALVAQGRSFAAAGAQAQGEVLAAFGIDAAKIAALPAPYALRIDGAGDGDAALLAVSAVASRAALTAAARNGTAAPAELSFLVNTIAAQVGAAGAVSDPAIAAAIRQAERDVDLAATRSNLQSFFARNGNGVTLPAFEEWVDTSGSGVLPQRRLAVGGIAFSDVAGAAPKSVFTSNSVTVAGLPAGTAVPVAVDADTVLIKNGAPVAGGLTVAANGDTLALRATSVGYADTHVSRLTVGATQAAWSVATRRLGGTISGLGGSGLVLQVNVAGNVSTLDGNSAFSFPAVLPNGASWQVSVLKQPKSPLQSCEVSNGSGVVGTTTPAIAVTCLQSTAIAFLAANPYAASSTVGAYTVNPRSGALDVIDGSELATGFPGIRAVAVAESARLLFLLVVDSSNVGQVLTYRYDTGTGLLTAVGGPVVAVANPQTLAVGAQGAMLFVAGSGIASLAVNAATGALTPAPSGVFEPASVFRSLAPDAAGRFLYAVDDRVRVLGIAPGSGALSPVAAYACSGNCLQLPFGGGSATRVLLHPSGDAVVAFYSGPRISFTTNVFSVDRSNGTLALLPTTGIGDAQSATFDPSGRFFYSSGSGDLRQYAFNAQTGSLTQLGTAPGGAGGRIVFEPSGAFAYTSKPTALRVDAATGSLSVLPGFVAPPSLVYGLFAIGALR